MDDDGRDERSAAVEVDFLRGRLISLTQVAFQLRVTSAKNSVRIEDFFLLETARSQFGIMGFCLFAVKIIVEIFL